MENHHQLKKPALPTVLFKQHTLKATSCIRHLLGNTIDFRWDMNTAVMDVSPSQSQHFQHRIQGEWEVFQGVPFRHSDTCPFLDKSLEPNNDSIVRPCVVVLIQNKNTGKILATQRHEHMSFGNQWVLPGGHLQAGEKLLSGGLRQCQQEVGLKSDKVLLDYDKVDLMVWQSVLVDEKNKKIKRAAMVVFFKIECQHFEVVEQKSEVKSWQWRSFRSEQYPWGGGWALGHISYLNLVNDKKG